MPGVVSTEESHTCWWGEIPIPSNITEVFCADYMRIQKKKKPQIFCFSQTHSIYNTALKTLNSFY